MMFSITMWTQLTTVRGRPRTARPAENVNVISLVTLRSVGKVLISKNLKSQEILEFVGHQLVASSTIFSQRPVHPEENNVPIRPLM